MDRLCGRLSKECRLSIKDSGQFFEGFMHINHYRYNVYHQFFSKLKELDYFLGEAEKNETEYRIASDKNLHFDKMQYLFSACVGALVSSWEIVRLSRQLENFCDGKKRNENLPGEHILVGDALAFHAFFETDDDRAYAWFCFLKASRNASAHDGSCSVNGGNTEIFKFQTDLHRFEWDRNVNRFEHAVSDVPEWGAVTSLFAMAHILVPLFFTKIKYPDVCKSLMMEMATFNMASSLSLNEVPEGVRRSVVEGLAEQISLVPERSIHEMIEKWKIIFEGRFTTV